MIKNPNGQEATSWLFTSVVELNWGPLETNRDQSLEWEQEWPSGESTCLPPMWPGFDSQIRRHMWVEFVGSLLRLLQEVFLWVLQFSTVHKNQYLI